jgi:O-antigen/teichoic acid export membrane protein
LSIKKSISFTFGAQIINTAIAFISSIFITRILGAEGRGEYTIFTNSISFAVLLFGFSINSTIPYFINSGKTKAEELLTTTFIFSLISTAMVYGILFLLEYIGKLYWVLPDSTRSVQYKLIFTGIYFNTLLSGVLSTCLLTFKKFKEVSIYTVSFQLFPLLIYLLLYFDIIPSNPTNPFVTVVFVTAIISFLSIIAIMILFVRIVPVRPVKKLIPLGLIKQFMLFSSLAYIGNVASFLNYKLDYWIVNEYLGKYELGIYSLAAQLSQLLWILPQAISSVLYSYASSSNSQASIRHAIQLKQLAFYGTLILGIIGLIISYYLIPILYGKEFTSAFNLMIIFLIGVIPYSIPKVSASLFASRGNFTINLIIAVIVFAISIALYLTLIPRYGLIGGAISSAIAYLLAAIMSELWFCKLYKVSIFNLFQIKKGMLSLSILTKK